MRMNSTPAPTNLTLSPVDDPELVKRIAEAWRNYEPPDGMKLPKGAQATMYRVSRAPGTIGVVGKILIVVRASRRSKPYTAVWRYENGEILPGDDLGPENFPGGVKRALN